MKVCFVHLYYNPENVALQREAYLEWVNLAPLPEEMARRGHEVHVVHSFAREESFVQNGVHYHFLAAGPLAQALGSVRRSGQRTGREPAWRAALAIRRLRPDVVHYHGIVLTLNLALLLAVLGRKRPPLVVQYHGGYPPEGAWRWRLQRAILRRVDRFLFTTRWHAQPYFDAGLLDDESTVVALMEVSTRFRRRSRAVARRQTEMRGDPVFLWAGRLHPVKDPLTALRGFERIATQWRGAQLYLYYLSTELLPELQTFVRERPHLAGRIHFRGRVGRPQMEAVYNSADFLLQGSRREFSGFAVLEAMACGVIPLVTDIPAFRQMTAGGRLGLLFAVGDARELADRVLSIDRAQLPALSDAIVAHFNRHLSLAALAGQLEEIYTALLTEREHGGT